MVNNFVLYNLVLNVGYVNFYVYGGMILWVVGVMFYGIILWVVGVMFYGIILWVVGVMFYGMSVVNYGYGGYGGCNFVVSNVFYVNFVVF